MACHNTRFGALAWLLAGVVIGVSIDRSFRRETSGVSDSINRPATNDIAAATTAANSTLVTNSSETSDPHPVPALEKLRRIANARTALDLAAALSCISELSAKECSSALELFRRASDEERRTLHMAIARRWASLDVEGLFAAASTSRDIELCRILTAVAARELVRLDPEAALTKLSGSLGPAQRQLLGRAVLTAVAERDPARAGAFLLERRDFSGDAEIFVVVARRWAAVDPREALNWAKSLPAGPARFVALPAAWTTWGEREPAVAAAEVLRTPENELSREVFAAITRAWSRTDARAAMEWIRSLPRKGDQDAAWNAFAPDVHQQGPDSILGLINAIPSDRTRFAVAAHVAGDLAREDPRAALAWVQRLPEGPLRNQAMSPVLDEWSRREPVQAVSYLAAMPASERHDDALGRAVAHWAIQDPDAALAWSREFPATIERDRMAQRAVRELREVDPAKVTPWLDLVQTPEARNQIVQDVLGDWARLDGAAAAKWLGELSDTSAQVRGHYAVTRQWAFTDAAATAGWMSALPSGPARDAAIHGFVVSIDGYDPALATKWAAAIEEPKERNDRIGSAFLRWLEKEPVTARAWLDSGVKLSGELRTALVQAAETGRTP